FHDAFRQRLEHIIQALRDTAGRPEQPPDAPGGPAADAFCALGLQAAQLEQLIEDTGRLHRQQSQVFQEISDAVAEQSACLHQLVTADGLANGGDVLADLGGALASVSGIGEECTRLAGEIGQAAAEAGQTASRLSGFTREVSTLSWQVRLNALNSIIKSERLASEGKTLEVLSRNMVHLAEQVEELVSSLTAGLAAITETIADEGPGTREETAAGQPAAFSEAAVRARFDGFAEAAAALLEEGRQLAQAIQGQGERLEFLRRIGVGLQEQHARLTGVAETLRPAADDLPAAARSDTLQVAAGHYTMARERLIHQSAVATAPGDGPQPLPGPGGERNGAGDGAPAPAVLHDGGPPAASELGNNVELF
nr:hypothetical protein [Desulfobacteraceae bacterium]